MAFAQGQLITATALNEVNNTQISYFSPHLNSSGQQWYNFYFYCNRPSGDTIGKGECQCGWWAGCNIWEYRLENGSWVQKRSVNNNGGMYNCNVTLSLVSYGTGSYRVEMMSSNYAHHRHINWLVNQKITNTTGKHLKGITPMTLQVNGSAPTYIDRTKDEHITADMLNAREIYTVE